MKRCLLLLLLLAALSARADLESGQWRTARAVRLPKLSVPQPVYLPLDDAALAGVAAKSEYRIVRNGKIEVPYRIAVEDGEAVKFPLQPRIVSRSLPGTVPSEILLDLGDRLAAPLLVDLGLSGALSYRCAATVEGSSDRKEWHSLGRSLIYHHETGLGQQSLEIPRQDDRYLRVRLRPIQGKVPEIMDADVSIVVAVARRLEPVVATFTQKEHPREHTTFLELDPGRRTHNLAEARFDIKEPAFDRPIQIKAAKTDEGQSADWAQFGQHLRRLKATQPVVIPLGFDAARRLHITIMNGDDKPLTIGGVDLYRFRQGLIFAAEPGADYALWYGRTDAPSPDYEFARLPLTTPPAKLPVATLGDERALPAMPAPPKPWSEKHPELFWTALAAVLLLLGGIIVRTMRAAGSALRQAN